jgi:hypothetical protein
MQRCHALKRAAGLFEESRIAIAWRDLCVHRERHLSIRRRDLPLPATGSLLLTAFIGADRFTEQMLIAGLKPDALSFSILTTLVDKPIGFTTQNIRDRRLRNPELRPDLTLQAARGTQLPHPLRSGFNDGLRLEASFTAAMRTARRAHALFPRSASIRTAV